MKIAIFGGTFNPLHIGHCMIAEICIKELNYDKIIFVPANIPPHKEMNNAPDAQSRLEMVQAFCLESAIDGNQPFLCEPCEIERKGISFTFDTVQFLLEKYKSNLEGKPALLLGEESASQFEKWHESEKLSELVDFVVANRNPEIERKSFDSFKDFSNQPTGKYKKDFVIQDFKDNFKYPFVSLKNPILPISSTEIRARIQEKMAFRYLVPEPVFHYIRKHKLYGFDDAN